MTIEKIYDGGILAEIETESDTQRLREYFSHIERCGVAKKWDDLSVLHITEEDFKKGPCYLHVDNSGSLVVMIRTRIPGDYWNGEFGWGLRPKLGDSFFDYSECPEWLQKKFIVHWDLYNRALIDHYAAKDAARPHRVAGFFD
jgi:hypothetical protein